MPMKFIFFLLFVILLAFFIGFNLDNKSDVSIVFYTFRDVPIFVGLLFAYAAGTASILPFFFLNKKKKGNKAKKPSPREFSPSDNGNSSID